MKQVILDTNFIITCIRQKIDFFEELKLEGTEIIIPKQVIEEIKKITESKKKLHFKEEAKLALKLLQLQKRDYKEIDLKEKYVDKAIINYAEKNKDVIIATLDKEIKKRIKNKKLVIRNKKKLELI